MSVRLSSSLFICLCFALLFFGSRPSPAEHRETWIEIQSPHFTVLSNAGEDEGRKAALQFEQIRALFLHLYPTLRVDSGKPTIVFAIKNEDSLKLFIPSYGQNSKGMHLGGFYHPSYDKNFAIVRMDIRGNGPLGNRTLYHEYTHAYFRYNFRGLPLWLDEGLAEFYGNTSIASIESGVGMPNEIQLRTLKDNQFLPIDQLLTIDRTSPLYNTREHSGIFYAESWALVHYLTISPDVRGQDLINKYLHALQATDDPIEAANQTFGDLKNISEKLKNYIHQLRFQYERVQLQLKLSEKDFTARKLSAAEGILGQTDFLLRSSHLPEGLEQLHEVEKLDPAAPRYHSEFGHYHLLQADYANAEKELQLAITANPNDISAHIDMAFLYLRRDSYTKESTPKIRVELEKVLSLSPDFAPAHAFLSIAYAQDPAKDTDKAFKAARRASELEPGNLAYFIDIGKALLAAGRVLEAKKIAETAQKVATTTGDRNMATSFTKQIEYKVNHPQETTNAKSVEAESPVHDASPAESVESAAHAEGQITELLCGHAPEVILTLTTDTSSLLLHVSDITKISIQDGAKISDGTQLACSKWKDRHAKVDYRAIASGMTQGEVENISLE
jgi:tetratricopeptide (TPR) repeat protein